MTALCGTLGRFSSKYCTQFQSAKFQQDKLKVEEVQRGDNLSGKWKTHVTIKI